MNRPKIIRIILSAYSELMFPQHCSECGIENPHVICDSCFNSIFVPLENTCGRCGRMRLSGSPGEDCGLCHGENYRFKASRSIYAYSGKARSIFLQAKFNVDRAALAKRLAEASADVWLVESKGKLSFGTDTPSFNLITEVPVMRPLSFTKRVQGLFSLKPRKIKINNRRDFNFSRLIAQCIADKIKVPWQRDVLQKIKDIPSQIGLSESERKRNVKGAFDVSARGKRLIDGKTVLLIDDLFTTGSTTSECSRVLKGAGAKEVYVLCLFSTVPTLSGEEDAAREQVDFDKFYVPPPIDF